MTREAQIIVMKTAVTVSQMLWVNCVIHVNMAFMGFQLVQVHLNGMIQSEL